MKLGPYVLGPNDTEENGIYTGDALVAMRELPGDCLDAVITDPPYCSGGFSESNKSRAAGQGLRSENIRRLGWFIGDNMGAAGLSWLMRCLAVESQRTVKRTGSLLIFCDWRMHAILVPAIESSGLRHQNLLIWNKGSMGLGFGFRHQHELIMHFTLGAPEYHDAGTSNVITAGRMPAQSRLHQTQKPLELMAYLVRVVVPPGGIVVDPFVGSGSTAAACKQLGRRYLAFEIDPDTAEMARQRVRETQPPLFVEEPEPQQAEMEL